MDVAPERTAVPAEKPVPRAHASAHADARNRTGRAAAMTIATPIKPGRGRILRLNFFLTRKFPVLLERLQKLSFIHFCRWTILTEFPYNGPPQKRERLHYEYLFFLSNYNGYWVQYIDAFANVVRDRMDKIWLNTYGYSKEASAAELKDVIRKNEYVASHYYSAYPEASTTMIRSALVLKRRFAEFDAEARDLADEELRDRLLGFLTANQRHL